MLNVSSERAGLRPGDNILEVNTVSFESIASSSAVKVLTGSSQLKIVISRIGKIPGFKFAREKTSWSVFVRDHSEITWGGGADNFGFLTVKKWVPPLRIGETCVTPCSHQGMTKSGSLTHSFFKTQLYVL